MVKVQAAPPVKVDPDLGSPAPSPAPRKLRGGKTMLRLGVRKMQAQNNPGDSSQRFAATISAARAADKARRDASNKGAHIVDCNASSFGALTMITRMSSLSTASRRKKRLRKHAEAPPGGWFGAAKLERNVGDTVISVAVSDDDSLFAAGATNKKAIVYSTSNGEVVATVTAKAVRGCCSFFFPPAAAAPLEGRARTPPPAAATGPCVDCRCAS